MIKVTLEFTNEKARRITFLLRKRYKKDKRTSLARLCKIAVFQEGVQQALSELEKAEKELDKS